MAAPRGGTPAARPRNRPPHRYGLPRDRPALQHGPPRRHGPPPGPGPRTTATTPAVEAPHLPGTIGRDPALSRRSPPLARIDDTALPPATRRTTNGDRPWRRHTGPGHDRPRPHPRTPSPRNRPPPQTLSAAPPPPRTNHHRPPKAPRPPQHTRPQSTPTRQSASPVTVCDASRLMRRGSVDMGTWSDFRIVPGPGRIVAPAVPVPAARAFVPTECTGSERRGRRRG